MFTNCIIILNNKPHIHKRTRRKTKKQTNKKTNLNNFPSNGNSKELYYEDLSAKSIYIHLIAFCACFYRLQFHHQCILLPKRLKTGENSFQLK